MTTEVWNAASHGSSRWSAVRRLAGRVVHAMAERRRRFRAVAALQALDRRVLKDLGMERSEITSVVYGLGSDRSRIDRT